MRIHPELIQQIKSLVDPETVLSYLGFNIVKRNSKELRGPCRIHGGDNPTAFRFNVETRTWRCYTHHCETDADQDLIGLIQKTTQQGFVDSVNLLASIAGIKLTDAPEINAELDKLRLQREMQQEVRRSQHSKLVSSSYLPEDLLENFKDKRSSYFLERGFPNELLDFYEIGGTVDKSGVARDTIPIRNEDGQLITVGGRSIDGGEPKYRFLGDIEKGAVLYNLNIARYYTGRNRTLILVEGFVDVWTLALLRVYNVVAAMGTEMSFDQVHLLWKYAENVLVLFDPDTAGRKAAQRVAPMLSQGALVEVIDLPDGKDPKNFVDADVKKYLGGIQNVDRC